MAKSVFRLTDLQVRKANVPGLYADGDGLYLQVSRSSAKSWIYRYTLRGRSREMGLGSFKVVSLSQARELALAARTLRSKGDDPIDVREAARRGGVTNSNSFMNCARQYISMNRAEWRNAKHAAQWEATLKTYVEPVIGNCPVQDLDTDTVLRILEPIWATKHETARRVRGRLENIIDWARARGFRAGENPARWRGHLEMLLPSITKVRLVRHHAALPFEEVPGFMKTLISRTGTAARALEFTILTASRTGEVLKATVGEVDKGRALWTKPASKMKAYREHRVPLSNRAVSLCNTSGRAPDQPLFPNATGGGALSNMSMLALLKRMGLGEQTVHGFRSSFRDWAAECTNYSSEVIEMALAHQIENKVEAAYRRGDLLEKRRNLMQDWALFCASGGSSNVVPLKEKERK